jgi:ABC-type glycerol-3-phosphate transport system substrate-binding protein
MDQNKNNFKLFLMVGFGFFILLGLVAFSTYKSTSSTNSSVEINIWGTIDKTTFDSYITQYKQDSGSQFKLTYTYKPLDVIDSDLVEAMATGKAPDAILIPQELEKRYLDKVYLLSIPERTFKDTYVQEAEMYIQPGGVFALPFFIDPLVMYWNRDMFSSANIATTPTNWSEFPLLAQKLSQSDNNSNIVKSAVSFGEYENVNNAKAIMSALIMQAGSPIVSLNNNGTYESKLDYQSPTDVMMPAKSALQFYTDYSNPKKSVYSWNSSLPSSKLSFLSEDLATYFGFASEYNDIKEKNPNLNFDVASMPQTVDAKTKITFGELYGFAILKTSQNVTPTINLLSSLVSADSVSTLLKYIGVAPARRDLIAAGSSDAAKTVFYNSALISKSWIDPNPSETSQIFDDMINNITTGKLEIAESISQASTKIDNLLK